MISGLHANAPGFNNIHGYYDIKDIVKRALDAEDKYNLLFIGPPASAKTLFLLGRSEYKFAFLSQSRASLRVVWLYPIAL
jgi:hypothetical protein